MENRAGFRFILIGGYWPGETAGDLISRGILDDWCLFAFLWLVLKLDLEIKKHQRSYHYLSGSGHVGLIFMEVTAQLPVLSLEVAN